MPSATVQHVLLQMVLKCADIGHLAADLKTHQRWAYQLEEEFFRQVLDSTVLLTLEVPVIVTAS